MSESGTALINTSVKPSQFPARTKLLRPFSVLLPLEGLGHIEEVAHEGKLPWPGLGAGDYFDGGCRDKRQRRRSLEEQRSRTWKES